jgi:hypothetical protein
VTGKSTEPHAADRPWHRDVWIIALAFTALGFALRIGA